MTTAAVIVAAGRGTRAGAGTPKQWRLLAGKPVVAHSLAAFRDAGITRRILVLHPDDMARATPFLQEDGVQAVPGGVARDASVRNALEALAQDAPQRVLIHDGARPLVTPALIARLIEALDTGAPGAAPALAVTEALWRGRDGFVRRSVRRDGLYRAQTPQAFAFQPILSAHRSHTGAAADDVEVAHGAGLEVAIVAGEESNIKLTWPEDLARAEAFLAARAHPAPSHVGGQMDIRSGTGFDVHRFVDGDKVILCGIEVPHTRGLAGHSDADVGIHALCDSIYGALGDGDIGRHFPPSDPQWRDAASRIFLEHAAQRVVASGYAIANADVTLICEAPRIGPHAETMRARLAELMQIAPERVNVKATTSEGLGFTGRGEGIAAMASALLVRS